MKTLALHDITKQDIEQFISRPSHALGLVGSPGIGKGTLANELASNIVGKDIVHYPYAKHISPDGQSISLDEIRGLRQFLKLKLPGHTDGIARTVIIEHAQLMTLEAQNAVLKLLEEPPANTLIILTIDTEQLLLPTIHSRLQRITVRQPAGEHLEAYFTDAGYKREAIAQALLISGNLPGLMQAILEEDSEHELVQATTRVREILQATPFDRITLVDALSKQKNESTQVIFMMQQMARAALKRVAAKNEVSAARKWQQILQVAYEAESAMLANAQTKLVLLDLMLNV